MKAFTLPKFSAQSARICLDVGLLLLRVGGFGLLMGYHVQHKLAHFSDELVSFPDPLGIGHGASVVMALLSEGGCSLLVALGLATRLASLPIVFSMLMVLTLASQGFEAADLQAALLYSTIYGALALLGPGRISLDHLLWTRTPRASRSVSAESA